LSGVRDFRLPSCRSRTSWGSGSREMLIDRYQLHCSLVRGPPTHGQSALRLDAPHGEPHKARSRSVQRQAVRTPPMRRTTYPRRCLDRSGSAMRRDGPPAGIPDLTFPIRSDKVDDTLGGPGSPRDLAQPRRDFRIPAARSVLVAHGRARRGVPEPGHEFGQRAARLRGEHRARVAQGGGTRGPAARLPPAPCSSACRASPGRVSHRSRPGTAVRSRLARCGRPGAPRLRATGGAGGARRALLPRSWAGPTITLPSTRTAPRRTLTTPYRWTPSPRITTSLRRSSTSSPNRSCAHAARRTIARRRSGIASTRAANSSRVAGSILVLRSATPPPRMVHGFAVTISIVSSSVAVCMMAFSRP